MAQSLGDLVINLSANIASLADGLGKAEAQTKRTADAIESSMGKAKYALTSLAQGLTVGAFVSWAEKTLDAAEQLNKLSQKTGIAVEELSKLQYAARLSDVDTDSLAKGIKKLSGEMVNAGDATSKSGKLMSALGVDLNKGINPAIEKLADAFVKLPDGPTKATLAVELFGKAGMELIPLLNQGSEGIKKMQFEAERLGIVMNKESAKAAEEFNDNMKAVKASGEKLGITLLNNVAPSLVRVSQAAKAAAEDSGILKAIWVSMGGIASEMLGLNDEEAVKVAKRLRSIRDEMDNVQKGVSPDRRELLIKGLVEPATIAEGQYKRLAIQMRMVQEMQNAMAGKYDDQASRAARQGQVLPGVDKAFADQINKILGSTKELSKAGEHYIVTLQKELLNTGDLYVANKKRLEVEEQLAQMMKEKIPVDAERARQLADEIDGARRLAEANAFLTAERKKDIEAAQRQGEALEEMVNSLDEEAENLEFELKIMGLSAAAREKEILQRRMLADITAAGDNAAAIRDITASYERMFKALDNIEGVRNFQETVKQAANSVGDIAVAFSHGVGEGVQAARNWVKQLRDDLVKLAAQKFFIQIIASLTGSSALGGIASSLGQGTVSGALGSLLGSGISALTAPLLAGSSSGFIGGSLFSEIAAGYSGGLVPGMGIAGELAAAFAAIPVWGQIALGIAAVAAAIGLLKPGGGPKEQGAFAGTFDGSGALLVSLGNGPQLVQITGDNQHSAAAQQLTQQTALGFAQALQALGGSSGNLNFGFGFAQDPRGSAASFVHALVQGASGETLFKQNLDNVGRSQEELQAALALESKRAILAALQHSDLPEAVAGILNAVDAMSASVEEIDAVVNKAIEIAAVLKGLDALNLNGLSLESLTAMQASGETLSQTFARVANQMAVFNDGLMSDAEKLAAARTTVTSGFNSLGVAVPKSRAEFLALVKGIDYSTESGRHLYDTLVQLYPAFLQVADAAERSHNAFLSIRDLIDQLNGVTAGDQLNRLVQQFTSGNSAFGGFGASQLIEAFKGMTEETFAGFDSATQDLIKAILALAVQIKGNTEAQNNTVSNIDPAYFVDPQQFIEKYTADFHNRYDDLINQQPTYLDKWSLQQTLMDDQIKAWETRARALEKQYAGSMLPPEYQALLDLMQSFANQTGGKYYSGYGQYSQGGSFSGKWVPGEGMVGTYTGEIEKQIAKLLPLIAEFGEQKGQQLYDLNEWYDKQKALVAGNQDALLALEELYGKKRADILAETSQAGIDELGKIKDSILKWRDSLLLSNLSPLTATERFTQAASSYSSILTAAQGGDVDALKKYQEAGQALLQEALSYYGRASTQYQALFNQILMDSSALGGDTDFSPPTSADITGVRDAVIDENAKLRAMMSQLIQAVGEIAVATTNGDKTLADALVVLGDTLNQAKEVSL